MKKDEPYRGRVLIGYCSRKHNERYATKKRSYIHPRSLIKKRNFITVMVFPGLFQIQGLSSWNINIVWNKYLADCCVYIPSIIYFSCWTRFCACFLTFPFITPCSNSYVRYDWNFNLVSFFFVDCFTACDDIPVIQLSYTDYIYAYNRILKMGMTQSKKIPPIF